VVGGGEESGRQGGVIEGARLPLGSPCAGNRYFRYFELRPCTVTGSRGQKVWTPDPNAANLLGRRSTGGNAHVEAGNKAAPMKRRRNVIPNGGQSACGIKRRNR